MEKENQKSFWEKIQKTIENLRVLKVKEKTVKEKVNEIEEEKKEKDKIKDIVFAILQLKDGELAIKILNYFLENPRIFLTPEKIKEIFPNLGISLFHLLRFGILVKKTLSIDEEEGYSLSLDVFKNINLWKEVLREYKVLEFLQIDTKEGKEELKLIFERNNKFHLKVEEILKDKLETVVSFGNNFNFLNFLEYLKKIWKENFYYFFLLAILEQLGTTNTEIIDSYGNYYLNTNFNLLFLEKENTNILSFIENFLAGNNLFPEHGLKFFIKKWENKQISYFLKTAQAYNNRNFIFILPPLEFWLKEKEFLETLFLKKYLKATVGERKIQPYSLEKCSFLGKINVQNLSPEELGYFVSFFDQTFYLDFTFLFPDRISEFQKLQKEIVNFPPKFEISKEFKDFLSLLYAIQIEHPLVNNRFPKKKILISEKFSQEIDEITEKIIYENNLTYIPAFDSLKKYCLVFSAIATLFEYFKQDFYLNDIPILKIPNEIKEEMFQWYKNQIKIRSELFK